MQRQLILDEYGIPHIFAPDHRGLFHAYGYAQMEAHGELLVRLYAQGEGTRRGTVRRRLAGGTYGTLSDLPPTRQSD